MSEYFYPRDESLPRCGYHFIHGGKHHECDRDPGHVISGGGPEHWRNRPMALYYTNSGDQPHHVPTEDTLPDNGVEIWLFGKSITVKGYGRLDAEYYQHCIGEMK